MQIDYIINILALPSQSGPSFIIQFFITIQFKTHFSIIAICTQCVTQMSWGGEDDLPSINDKKKKAKEALAPYFKSNECQNFDQIYLV